MSNPPDLSTSAGVLSEPEASLFFRECIVISTSTSDEIEPKMSLMECDKIELIASNFGLLSLFQSLSKYSFY